MLRMIMPTSAITPSRATKPNGFPRQQGDGHADHSQRRGDEHQASRGKLCSWIISKRRMAIEHDGA